MATLFTARQMAALSADDLAAHYFSALDAAFLQPADPPTVPVMRRPDRTELEFAMLAFMVLAPMAYFTVRGLMALLSG